MNKARRITARSLSALLLLVAALALTACGDDGEATEIGDAPAKLTIGYQAIPNGDLVVKNKRWLEDALPDTEIEWKLFDSGGKVNEAFAAKSLDIGLVGSSPVSRGLSSGIDYQVPWIFAVLGEAEALIAKPEIGSIADLKGKTVAVPKASTTDFSLRAALTDAGVDPADVKIIDAEPDAIYSAWKRGDIDATYVWNPNLAKLKEDGGKVLITSAELAEKGTTTYDLAAVSNEFAEKFPGVLDTWAQAQDRAVHLIQDSPDEAAEAVAAELSISKDEALEQFKGLIFLTAEQQIGEEYLAGGLAKNLHAAAEFNAEIGEIEKAEPLSVFENAVNIQPAKSVKE